MTQDSMEEQQRSSWEALVRRINHRPRPMLVLVLRQLRQWIVVKSHGMIGSNISCRCHNLGTHAQFIQFDDGGSFLSLFGFSLVKGTEHYLLHALLEEGVLLLLAVQ